MMLSVEKVFLLSVFIASSLHLVCASCGNGEVRLSEGQNPLAGRVEICFNNQWGTVCAEPFWTQSAAQVVCRQLGHSPDGAVAIGGAHFGEGSGEIFLSNIHCSGSEEKLTDCSTSLLGQHACTHASDAGVVCQSSGFSCEDGEVQLVGGEKENEGRVEICFNNQFGTVCDDNWDGTDATVICKQLGFAPEGALALGKAQYGEGYGPVYLDEVNCSGTEASIIHCGHSGVGNTNCNHMEDAAVICKVYTPQCQDGDVRLVNGRIPSEGRVEVCHNDVWGTVCHDNWGEMDAAVVCSELGYGPEGARAVQYADFGEGSGPILYDNVKCKGSEQRLNECPRNDLASHNCGHNKDAGVICKDSNFSCNDGDVRLVGGLNNSDGRVEVCYDNHFGTVCEENWTNEDAGIVCSQLGFGKEGAIAVKSGYYKAGVGVIFLDNIECSGSEQNLLQCPHRGVGVVNMCDHSRDAGVICRKQDLEQTSCKDGDIRLVDGSITNEGRVEISYGGHWLSVCDKDWSEHQASDICTQLGLGGQDALATPAGFFATGRSPAVISGVNCTGNEDNVLECSIVGLHECDPTVHSQAGVICRASEPSCTNGDVRLVDGGNLNQGRVELCFNGRWGTVYGENWSNTDAAVICKQLGHDLSVTRAIAVSGGGFGSGEGPIFLADVHCFGVEDNLLDCPNSGIHAHNLPHFKDAGVVCLEYLCEDGNIRLTDGSSQSKGRLEVCRDRQWWTISSKGLLKNQGDMSCDQLGFSAEGSLIIGGYFPGEITDGLQYNQEKCNGSIQECLYLADTVHIRSEEAVGLICNVVVEGHGQPCSNGAIRLVDGANDAEGRVEVCIGGEWGSVCDDSWDDRAASVVCRQLGLPSESPTPVFSAHFGMGKGKILLDDVKCLGNESALTECLAIGYTAHNCQHREDAGVLCQDLPTSGERATQSPGNTAGASQSLDDAIGPSDSVESSTGDQLTIPIAAMGTIAIVAVCAAVSLLTLYKWSKQRRSQSLSSASDNASVKSA